MTKTSVKAFGIGSSPNDIEELIFGNFNNEDLALPGENLIEKPI